MRADCEQWLSRRRLAQEAERYKTQLDAIGRLVRRGADELEKGLDAIDPSLPAGAFYEQCRALDLRLLWLRKVWEFFAEKFDQRDRDSLAGLLKAADEIIWSCYHQLFERARLIAPGLTREGAPPLPFIEPRYSPSTFPADLVPAGLRSEVDRPFLTEHLNRLPVPVVRLQPGCVSGPWWLIYAAHEVGHSVQYDLLADRAMVHGYRRLVEGAVRRGGGDSGDVSRWGAWSREIFADIFSVLTMGTWAIWAMVELELQPDHAMAQRRELYPSGAVRLELLRSVAVAVGLELGSSLRGLDPAAIAESTPEGRRDAGFVEAVVSSSLDRLPGLPATLAQLCNFRLADFQPGASGAPARISGLRRALTAEKQPAAVASVDGPRLGAAAALAAWAGEMSTADEAARKKLAERSVRLIAESGPPGTRGVTARPDPADPVDAVDDLVSSLVSARPDELEV